MNQRRLEHLSSLGLNFTGSTVLEVGAGIGDHTNFFLDRGCSVVSTDVRQKHLKILRSRYSQVKVRLLDLDKPDQPINESFDIIYCYGLLYHLKKPAEAIKFMSGLCRKMLLIETRVSFGDGEFIEVTREAPYYPSASVSGYCSKPSRKWVYNQLKQHFNFVYMPITQPNHEEFPIDWSSPPPTQALIRSVFIASRQKLNNDLLVEHIPFKQTRN